MKRVAACLVVVMMLAAVLAACSKSNSESSGSPTSSGSSQPGENRPEPVPLTMMVQNHPAWPLKEDWLVWKQHEKNANVKLSVSGYQGDWWDAIPLVVASGDMPDLMWMAGNDMIHRYGADGAIVNLLDHLDKMPNLKAFMDAYPEEITPLLSTDGKLYVNPSRGAYGTYDGLFLYREDIFKKHDLKMPETYDELYDTLVKLKELYPDSTPLYFNGLDSFNRFGLPFDTAQVYFVSGSDGKVHYGPVEENYRQLLEFAARAYKDKLIPIEFGNSNSEQRDKLLTTDKTFILYGYINNIDTYNNQMREINPDYKLAFMVPPKGPTGLQYNATQFLLGEGLTVSSESKHLDAALHYIDYLFTDQAKDVVSWGEEGVTYEVVDGKKKFLPAVPDLKTASAQYGIKTSGNMAYFDNDSNLALMSEEASAAYMEAEKYVMPRPFMPPLTKQEDESIQLKMQAIGKYVDENISKFVIGQKPLSEWDAYVEGVKKLGLDDVLKVYNEALDRLQSNNK